MNRRGFLLTALGGAIGAPAAGWAQQRLRRVALVAPTLPIEEITEAGVRWRFMMLELRRMGLVEGKNILFERYSALGQVVAVYDRPASSEALR